MEDNSVKNFDRSIEQMMNEHSVAPPFGAWNRIAAELDAAPVAITTPTSAPVSYPFFHTGTVMGFVSGALMIGAMVTGWLLYQNYTSVTNTTPEVLNVSESVTNTAEPSVVAPVVVEAKTEPRKYEPAILVSAVNSKQKKETAPEVYTVKLTENEVAAPIVKLPVDKQKSTEEAYYFPPVDINIPESKLTANEVAANVEDQEESADADEAARLVEVKKVASNSSTAKVKFKKKRSAGWNYGKINRTKSRSKY